MRTPSFPTIHTPFSFTATASTIRSSFRRNSSSASRSSYASNASITSHPAPSSSSSSSSQTPIPNSLDAILSRQPSMAIMQMHEERRVFGSGLAILEPRPVVYWGGFEERLESL